MHDAELADDRNQMDLKIDPRLACFFQNTRCSILPLCSILPRLTIPSAAHECTLNAVRDFRLKHLKNLIISHYNVNSIRHKFCEMSPSIAELHIDILAITESKLDDSFLSEQFNTCNYKLYRQDRNSHGGGIMIYVNDCIPHRLIKDHTGVHLGVEFMTIEVSVKSNKWYLCYIYIEHPVLLKKSCVIFYMNCVKSLLQLVLFVCFRWHELQIILP